MSQDSNSSRPNILWITSDQQHWNTLGMLNPEIKTPNLDRLANDGTLFTRAYCPNPTCTPTRASLITGLYPSQHGAWSLGTKLPESVPTLGDRLQAAGYRTALIGKAHFQQLKSTPEYPSLESNPKMQDLEFWNSFHGPFYGFDHIELARNHADEFHVGQHYALWMEEKGFKDWRDCFQKPAGTSEPQRHKWNIPEAYHYNTWIAERAGALLDGYRKNREPFFLWASFLDPHGPYLAPEPWDTMYDPAKLTLPQAHAGEFNAMPAHFKLTQQHQPDFSAWREQLGNAMHGFGSHLIERPLQAKNLAVYYAMISMLDKYIGKILDHLDELGLRDNTLVVFTTDHGHFFGQHGLITKGAFHYEDLLRVPFILRWPGHTPAGARSPALFSLVDMAPTTLSACGIPPPFTMSGRDFRDVWLGRASAARDHVLVENRHQPTTIWLRTYVDERYKITVYHNRDYGELFDLEKDPGEFHNLWNEPKNTALKNRLIQKMLFAEMGKEPLWMPRVANA